jgi:hypothetical protein
MVLYLSPVVYVYEPATLSARRDGTTHMANLMSLASPFVFHTRPPLGCQEIPPEKAEPN